MSGFVKTTGPLPEVSGVQKAAILLAELGTENTEKVYSYLKLSPEEVKRLKDAMDGLGVYSTSNPKVVAREVNVLTEALDRLGVDTNAIIEDVLNGGDERVKEIKAKPAEVAEVLRSWLSN